MKKKVEIKMPKGAEFIIRSLEKSGFEAYIVGGCVRDAVLGREPEDWDITTSARPEEVKSIFRTTVDTGIEHGTVTVLLPKDETGEEVRSFELTTFRIDGEYEDSRHPKRVSFTSSLTEDLARRDFTINAMAYHMDMGLIDPFSGMIDLENKTLRAVGKAEERFKEDALRMMRGIRFSAQLNFSLEEDCFMGMRKLKENLGKVSKERIAVELWKLLASEHPEKVEMLFSTGLSPYITRDFPKIGEAGIPILIPEAPKEKILRFGLFLRNVPMYAGKILRELKLDRMTIDGASRFAKLFSENEVENPYALRKRIASDGMKMTRDFYVMQEAILKKKENTESDRLYLTILQERVEWLKEIEKRQDCVSFSEMKLGGKDLISLGVSPGKALGELLHCAFDYVLHYPSENDKEKLISYLRKERLLQRKESLL